MTTVTIKATHSGSYFLSGTGSALSPFHFLMGDVFGAGKFFLPAGSSEFVAVSADGSGSILIEAVIESGIPAAGIEGGTAQIAISGFEFFRIEDGIKINIGAMILPQPIEVEATFQGGTWVADIADAIEAQISDFGIEMKGGKGVDVFDASDLPIPLHGAITIKGRGGDDILTGGVGDDVIKGGRGDDLIYDPGGANLIKGGHGDDRIEIGPDSTGSKAVGGSGNDTLISSLGDDKLIGGQGNDWLFGGGGDDILRGGAGADVFVFNNTQLGHDIIRDFQDGTDLLEMQGIGSFEELNLTQKGNDVVIDWGVEGTSVTLKNTDMAALDPADFLFLV